MQETSNVQAEIIAVGSELLLGQIANTNAQFISGQLAEAGVNVHYHTVVGDNPERLRQAIHQARARANMIIFTGGLGPTKDDLTKQTVADTMEAKLTYDQEALGYIKDYFKKTGRNMTENNKQQALVIEGAEVLPNRHGMAPGMIAATDHCAYILLPGPPSEMKPMFLSSVKPYLQGMGGMPIHSRVLRFFGIGESALETDIMDLIENQTNPTIAPLAGYGEVTIRLSAASKSTREADELLNNLESIIQQRVGDYFYGYGEKGLAETCFERLNEQQLTVSAAESLTGGLFAKTLTDFSGASSVFGGGVTTYTDEAKATLLQIPRSVIAEHGAVSAETAEWMAGQVRKHLHTDIGIGFTGVAGPIASEGQEVGTVFIGLSTSERTQAFFYQMNGTRDKIRDRTVKRGIDLIRRYCLNMTPFR
ncbi:competence/damage-inducible protein A [Tuberibacillus sp. Marseille-P3662]|uniref:competence/damage-inducible protein A n=1 Tax=Tuberibacillus sp. Marseille-P3662 TaxID=1965358 RepID=UPI000A1C8855|nr:competence/damage-inducible protein A [Tuberibacillus sp. Marseille-P3662]